MRVDKDRVGDSEYVCVCVCDVCDVMSGIDGGVIIDDVGVPRWRGNVQDCGSRDENNGMLKKSWALKIDDGGISCSDRFSAAACEDRREAKIWGTG